VIISELGEEAVGEEGRLENQKDAKDAKDAKLKDANNNLKFK
jgi:hypothetical protein